MSEIRDLLVNFLKADGLPFYDSLFSLCNGTVTVLEGESPRYRPVNSRGARGGLLDFSTEEFTPLPLAVVPDLHARGGFLMHLLDYTCPVLGGSSALELLEEGKIRVVCVGDIFHSEGRCRDRWKLAWKKYYRNDFECAEMVEEMRENLSLLKMLFTLKTLFPEHFHILKGNHENINNESENGNFGFRKFADEGNMVYDFMASQYDEALIHLIDCFEKALPLCAMFPECVVSHAEPLYVYERQEIIERMSEVTEGLTWTANDNAEEGSVVGTMKNLYGAKYDERILWFAGHRPISGKYALRQGGRFVQIHNPNEENVVILRPRERIDLEKDIYAVGCPFNQAAIEAQR